MYSDERIPVGGGGGDGSLTNRGGDAHPTSQGLKPWVLILLRVFEAKHLHFHTTWCLLALGCHGQLNGISYKCVAPILKILL